jgi:hypothetical protein
MRYTIPTSDTVRAVLAPLSFSQLKALGKETGVPLSTIRRIKAGSTKRPDVDCVKKLFDHLRVKVQK